MSALTEDRVREIVREELAHVEAANTGAGYTQPPQGDPLAPRIDAEQPRGTPGTTWVQSVNRNLPNPTADEGASSYTRRVSIILERGNVDRARLFADATGFLTGAQATAFGFRNDDRSVWPDAAGQLWIDLNSKSGPGTVGR